MSYSLGTYVINNLEERLIFEPVFYGLPFNKKKDFEKKQYINPKETKETKEISVSDIDFFLQNVPNKPLWTGSP